MIGAAVGAAVSAYSQYKSTGKVEIKKTVGAAVEGAVVGGVGAATAGASLGVAVLAGAAAGAAGNTANQLISTGKVDKKQVAVSAIGGAAGNAGAKLAGAAVNAGSEAASQAISKVAGNAGKQAAAKAGSSILGKTIAASAKGGIVGASAGASADLAMQIANDEKHDIRNVNWKEVGGSALLGGGVGAGVGAASQTKLGQKVSASQAEWDKKINAGIDKFKSSLAGKKGKGTTLVTHRGTNKHIEEILQKRTIKAYGPRTTADAIIDHENPAVWVSEGKPTWINRMFSGMVGKKGEASITFEVPSELLQSPSGIKRFFGKNQRVIEQDVHIPDDVMVRKAEK